MVNGKWNGPKRTIRSVLILLLIMLFPMWGGGHDLLSAKPVTSAPLSMEHVHTVSKDNDTIPSPSVSLQYAGPELLSAASSKTATQKGPKTVYLTFDDGPSKLTPEVLDILQKNNIKATFFVLGEQAKRYPELIGRIYEDGHSIGNHSYNHNYTALYQSFANFWDQIKKTEEEVRLITGVRPQLVRAPGGTAGHFDDTYFGLLKQAGYVVMDWDVDSGDSKRPGVPAADILRDATSNMKSSSIVLLMHDGSGHDATVKALPDIIKRYRDHGYQFGVLTADSEPVQFKVNAKAKGLHRPEPSAAWIESHIKPNRALFETGLPLRLEVGPIETTLDPGEYRVKDGQYMVPLRTVTERLGGSVEWNGRTREAVISLDPDVSLTVNVPAGTLVKESKGVKEKAIRIPVAIVNDAVWVPLRPLLERSGHVVLKTTADAEERRVRFS